MLQEHADTAYVFRLQQAEFASYSSSFAGSYGSYGAYDSMIGQNFDFFNVAAAAA